MHLSESQKKHLRGLAHSLKPCIHVGNGGVTAAVLAELGNALEHHELLKVKVRCGDREAREAAIALLVDDTGATLLQRIGNVAVLYRPAAENPRILLPA
jgi:RNA-binding protein